MKGVFVPTLSAAILAIFGGTLANVEPVLAQQNKPIVHDAQYYILDAQNGETWAAEDKDLDARLAALCQKYGRPPNIIHLSGRSVYLPYSKYAATRRPGSTR